MDQDNKHISIDDLVRQRLGGHEEPERPGAWANMRTLLDEQERKTPRGAFLWNRRNLSALLLLLLGSATMGSLLVHRFTLHTDQQENTSPLGTAAAGRPGGNSSSTGNAPVALADTKLNNEPANSSIPAANHTNPAATSVSTTTGALKSNTATQPGLAAAPTNSAARNNRRNSSVAVHTSSATAPDAATNPATRQARPDAGTNANNAVASANNQPDVSPSTPRNNRRTPATATNTANSPLGIAAIDRTRNGNHGPNATASPDATAANTTDVPKNTGKPESITRRGNRQRVAGRAAANATPPATDPAALALLNASGANATAPKASVPKADATQRQVITVPKVGVRSRTVRDPVTHKRTTVYDTTDRGTTEIVREVPVLAKPDDAAAQAAAAPVVATVVPTATPIVAKRIVLPEPWEPVLTPAAVNLAARTKAAGNTNTSLRLHSSQSNAGFDGKLEVRDFFRRLNFSLSQIKVHPGMTAGLNSAPFGDIKLNGFHLGASATFVLNEAWSILSELRYTRKMAGNQVLNDDYVQCSPYSSNVTMLNGVPTTTYAWTEDSVSRFFNIAGLHYLDLPVHIRYHYRKFFFEGGLNLLYAFATNVEEREYQVAQGVQRSYSVASQYASGFVPGYNVKQPTILGSDFGSRFGLGYSLGAGYQISPAVQADLRVSRQFWDNSKTRGAMKVSDILYNQPVIQISIGYRFGERE